MADSLDIAAEVESFAYAFERALSGSAAFLVEDYFPPRDHPAFADIALELLRIDLEQRWRRGRRLSLDDYRQRFPEILGDSERLTLLAFEEYRQRCDAGEAVAPHEYVRLFGVRTTDWPSPYCVPASGGRESAGDPCVCENMDAVARFAANGAAPGRLQLPMAGDRFADFELVEELGRGSFARVFLARQSSLAHRPVALKISRGLSLEPDRLAQLQHSNIVPIYSVHQVDGLQGVCMPYLGRTTLAQVMGQMRSSGSRPRSGRELLSTIVAARDDTAGPGADPQEREAAGYAPADALAPSVRDHFRHATYADAVIWIIARLASGLAHAHERGILHRDLKPANVLFSDDGRPMILDFNLAEKARSLGVSAAMGGTLPYMSPEQLRALVTGAAVDERSDVYSLGVMLYELLTDRLPFAPPVDGSAEAIAGAISDRRRGLADVRELTAKATPSIVAVLVRCLTADPAGRYQTAEQLREDLDRHLENRPLVHVAVRSPRERTRKWMRRHPRLSSAASIGLVASLVIASLIGAWGVRERRFDRIAAQEQYRSFSQAVREARLPLVLPGADAGAYAEGKADVQSQLHRYRVLAAEDWRQSAAYLDLAPADRESLAAEVLRTLRVLATSSLKQALLVNDPHGRNELLAYAWACNAKAIDLVNGDAGRGNVAVSNQQKLIRSLLDGQDATIAAAEIQAGGASTDQELAAVALMHQGRYRAAIPRLEAWRDGDSGNVAAWMMLGAAYAGIGNHADAEVCFTTCTRLRPQLPLSYFQRGLARQQLKKFRGAVDDFSQYVQRAGQQPAALINRALASRELGDYTAAADDLDAAIDGGATQTRAYFIRAAVRRELGDLPGAEQDFQRGLELTPRDGASWIARGMAKLGQSPESALADFREAYARDPGNRLAAQNILHILSDRLHLEDEALEMLDELLAADPSDVRALATRAVLRARRGEERAAADAEAALQGEPSPKLTLQAACAYAQLSRIDPGYRAKSLHLTGRSLGSAPTLASIAASDPDLAPVRDSEEFARIIDAANVLGSAGAANLEGAATAP